MARTSARPQYYCKVNRHPDVFKLPTAVPLKKNAGGVTHPAPASKLPLRSEFAAARLGGDPVVLLGNGLAAASSSDDPRPRGVDSLRRDRKESVVAKLGLLAVVAPGPDAFASGRLQKIIIEGVLK